MNAPTVLLVPPESKKQLIEKLLDNTITSAELKELREIVNADDLSVILQRIYDLNESSILKLSAVEGMIEKFNRIKNAKRNRRFDKKITRGFREIPPVSRRIVLVEGDSWFNYPIILTDVIDRIAMEKNLAVYSIASGGDWLLNMLTGRQYVEELSVMHPDWFLISGGGNDLVGSRRIAAILQPTRDSTGFQLNQWAQDLFNNSNKTYVHSDTEAFHDGLHYLSKDFYALLMFFHLQYYYLFSKIYPQDRNECKFPDLQIITQGYDYPIPSFKKNFGPDPTLWYVPFIRKFLGHGEWLKGPMQIRGLNDPVHQRNVLYTMIYLFNEMMIELGSFFNKDPLMKRIYHIDSRGSIPMNGWADELHPKPKYFMRTGSVFVDCIQQRKPPTYEHVYVVDPKPIV